MSDPKDYLIKLYAATQPSGPAHQWAHVHQLLQVANEASLAARNVEPLRKDLERLATAAGKQALAVSKKELLKSG